MDIAQAKSSNSNGD